MLPPASDGEHPHTPVVSEQQPPYQQSAHSRLENSSAATFVPPHYDFDRIPLPQEMDLTKPSPACPALLALLTALVSRCPPTFSPHCSLWLERVAFLSTCTCSRFFGVAYFSCFSTCNPVLEQSTLLIFDGLSVVEHTSIL